MTEAINPGDVHTVSAEFALVDDDGVRTLADPTEVSLSWQRHRGEVTTWVFGDNGQIVNDGEGLYHADIDLTGLQHGLYHYVWTGTGVVQAVESGTFVVTPTWLEEPEGS